MFNFPQNLINPNNQVDKLITNGHFKGSVDGHQRSKHEMSYKWERHDFINCFSVSFLFYKQL